MEFCDLYRLPTIIRAVKLQMVKKGWAYGSDKGDKKCIKNFGMGISWKISLGQV